MTRITVFKLAGKMTSPVRSLQRIHRRIFAAGAATARSRPIHCQAAINAANTNRPMATVSAYRKTGSAVVTVSRGARKRRYIVSLNRWKSLREWTAFGNHPWKKSGAWLRSNMIAYLWERTT